MKECVTGNTVTSDRLVNLVLDCLHNRLQFCLCLLAFACKLDLVKGDEPTMDPSCPTEVVKGILKLSESEFLLTVDDAGYAK